jgi:type II secretory pathway component GspD/PulD (secretin)
MPVNVVPDAATNRLVVSAPADKMPKVEELIRALDEAVEDAGRAKIVHLKHADPQQMAKIIASATATTDSRGRRRGGLQVTADTRTNTLIISGDAGDIQEAEKLLAELDREIDPQERTREIHVVQLQAGDARQVAQSLIRLFSEQTGGRRGSVPDSGLRVEAERATNSLIISCAPADWTIINEILGKIKESVDPLTTPTIRLVPLKFAKAGELADTIRQVFGGRGRRREAGDVPVIITAAERANSLLISAAADDQDAISELIRALDVDAAKEIVDPVQIITLKAAEAERLANTLRAMIPRPGRGQAQEIFIQADALTNSVLVRAPESERMMIEQMIAQLDKQTQEEGRQTSVKTLKHVSASLMASMLGQLFPGSTPSRRGRRGAPSSDDPERVVIAAAPGDRMLVIDAPLSEIRRIEDLVATLDAGDSPVALKYRTYQLEKADAADLARSLSRLFAEQRGRSRGGADSAEIPARFEANAISNQLIVAATNEQLEEVEALIRDVEASVVLAAETRTIRLKHAKADDIAKVDASK